MRGNTNFKRFDSSKTTVIPSTVSRSYLGKGELHTLFKVAWLITCVNVISRTCMVMWTLKKFFASLIYLNHFRGYYIKASDLARLFISATDKKIFPSKKLFA